MVLIGGSGALCLQSPKRATRQKLLGSKVGYSLRLMLNCKTCAVAAFKGKRALNELRHHRESHGSVRPGMVQLEEARLAPFKLKKSEASCF